MPNLLIFLKIHPSGFDLQVGSAVSPTFSKIGHFGAGDLELRVSDPETLRRALPRVQASYELS